MTIEFDKHERYSLCIAWSNGAYYKYCRIADYDPSTPRQLKPSLLESDFNSPIQKRDNPSTLYHQQITVDYYGRTEDYYLLEWIPNPDRPGYQLTRVFNYSDAFPSGLTPKEVIVIYGAENDEDLREALHNGFPCPGHTTEIFYLAFTEHRDSYSAIRCERKDFFLEDGQLKLRAKVSNFKDMMSVPKVRLEKQKVIWSRHQETGIRGLYTQLGEVTPIGRLLLWHLSSYAEEYVKWFIHQEDSVKMSRTDRQRIATVVRQALDRPDMLEKYVGDTYDSGEVEELKLAVSRYAQFVEDPARRIICDALVKDKTIHDECVQLVLRDSQELIDEKRKELVKIDGEGQMAIDAKKKEMESLEAQALSILADIETAESELKAARNLRDAALKETDAEANRLESLRAEGQRALEEIESNLALKLGLKAVASSVPQAVVQESSSVRLKVSPGELVKKTGDTKSLAEAVSKNMSHLGISSIVDEPSDARRRASLATVAGASICRVLAMPSPVASRIADSLSIALSGKCAAHVVVPTDYKDVASIINVLPSEEPVVVFDNVIDPVNEAVLFSLLEVRTEQVFVFPFASHGSARLLTREVWDRVYMPCIESLAVLPSTSRAPRFYVSKEGLVSADLDADEIADEAKELYDDLHALGLSRSSFVIPAIVKLAVEENDEDESGFFAIAQHLAMASSLDSDAYDTLKDMSPEDSGIRELYARLGVHVG